MCSLEIAQFGRAWRGGSSFDLNQGTAIREDGEVQTERYYSKNSLVRLRTCPRKSAELSIMTVSSHLSGLLPLTGLNGVNGANGANGATKDATTTTKNGATGATTTTNGDSKKTTSEYVIPSEDLGTPRKLRLVIVGAGASGLNMARHLELHTENIDYAIYEKNPEVGGTWFENRCVTNWCLLSAVSDKYQIPRMRLRHS